MESQTKAAAHNLTNTRKHLWVFMSIEDNQLHAGILNRLNEWAEPHSLKIHPHSVWTKLP